MYPHHFRKLGIPSLNLVISFCVGAFHVKSIKNGEIYMTVFDFYEIWCRFMIMSLCIPLIFRSISVSFQAIVSLKFDTVVLDLVQMFRC